MRIVMEESGVKQLGEATTFEELGMDSLDFVSMIQAIEKEFGPIPKSHLIGIENVGNLIDVVEAMEC